MQNVTLIVCNPVKMTYFLIIYPVHYIEMQKMIFHDQIDEVPYATKMLSLEILFFVFFSFQLLIKNLSS